jgi:hypothetical protein
MSHDRSWRAACVFTITIPCLHFGVHSIARGVTAVGVGSGALFGGLGNEEQSDTTSKINVRASRFLAIECDLFFEKQLFFCRLRMPDEVAALPSPASTFQTHIEQRRDRIYANNRPTPLRPRTRAPSSRVARHSSAPMRRPRHRHSSVIDHTYQLSL